MKIRDLPSSHDLCVLTSYYDPSTHKWLESRRASDPFISVRMTKINPKKSNMCEDQSANLCLMADSVAMCSLLNYETVEAMGLNPDDLELSSISITDVNGKNSNLKPGKCT